MNWENCKQYGLIEIASNGSLHLHYDRFYFLTAPKPNPMMTVESAQWQGNSVIIRGCNQYGEPLCYILRDLYYAEQIIP